MLFFWIFRRILNKMYHNCPRKCNAAQLFSKLLLKKHILLLSNQHIRMISDRSCDAEVWSNGCWKFSFAVKGINDILKYINIENGYLILQ